MGQEEKNNQDISTIDLIDSKRPYPWLDYTITDF